MDTVEIAVNLWTVPADHVGFQVLKDNKPASNVNVTVVSKDVVPRQVSHTTDESGIALFDYWELTGTDPSQSADPEKFKTIPWLFMAFQNDSEYGVWKDDVKFALEQSYSYALKKYDKVPTFFLKLELRDIVGVEVWSRVVAVVEEVAAKFSGLNVTEISGQNSRFITVKFQPPVHQSPIVINWSAVWFILEVLAVVLFLVVLRWTFGEVGAMIVGGGAILLAFMLLGGLAGVKGKERERYE